MWLIYSYTDKFEVGYFKPDGQWFCFEKGLNKENAIELCSKLNGGNAVIESKN